MREARFTASPTTVFSPAALAPAGYSIEPPTGEHVRRSIQREHTLLLARRLEREVMTYRMALSANPKDADARLQIGTIYARNGIEEVALKEFEAILAHDPKHASAHNNRGNLFFARGDYDRALDSYRTAESADPADGGIRMNAALAYYRLGKLAEARGQVH
jgi:Flp pilus assembly protein TadD